MARVLLADDDRAMREFVQRALQADGHLVTLAEDGAEALQRVEAERFDLLISDLDMPGLDGFALVSRVAGRQPQLRIILMSGHADELKRAEGLPPGRVATLPKPFTLEKIRQIVRAILQA